MHIVIDAVTLCLPKRVQAFCALLVEAVVLVLMGAVTYYGYILCTLATQATSTLKIPQYTVYLVVPISAALIFLHSLREFWSDLHGVLSGEGRS